MHGLTANKIIKSMGNMEIIILIRFYTIIIITLNYNVGLSDDSKNDKDEKHTIMHRL